MLPGDKALLVDVFAENRMVGVACCSIAVSSKSMPMQANMSQLEIRRVVVAR